MIIVKLQGGLGNQLFQVAFARELKSRGREVYLDDALYRRKQIHDGFTLARHADVGIPLAGAEPFARLGLSRNWTLHEALRKATRYARKVILEDQDKPVMPAALDADDVYCDGYWQDERYFPSVHAAVRAMLDAVALDADNAASRDDIRRGDAVSVHVRRGDYVNLPLFAGCCDEAYYARALDRFHGARFFVFSDDIAWCRAHLRAPGARYIDHNPGDRSVFDLLLMAACTHHVIANSSFSWWGAWQDANPGKIVIAPARWYNDPVREAVVELPEGWIRV